MYIPAKRRLFAAISAIAVSAATLVGSTGAPATAISLDHWVGSWGAAVTAPSVNPASITRIGFTDQSVRQTVRTSIGGKGLRIRLSNVGGDRPLFVGHATIALPVGVSSAVPDLVPGSIKELTFGGSQSITVFKGTEVLSDPVMFTVPSLQDFVVTMYFPQATGNTSWHWQAKETAYIYSGDQTGNTAGSGATLTHGSFHFLTGVDVLTSLLDGNVTVLGDSITDGFTASFYLDHRWTDYLAARVADRPGLHLGVVNMGLSGNAVTRDGLDPTVNSPVNGPSGLSRLNDDVLSQSGERTVVVALGINDVLAGFDAPRIIAGLKQLAVQSRATGVRAIVCTLSPSEGYVAWTPAMETVRTAVNEYIRGNTDYNGVIDFDATLRDPAAPTKLLATLDSGDHIHPNDAGYEVMGNSIPLWLL